MAEKNEISELLRTPECIQCFEEIREQGNSVFGSFEVHAKDVLNDFKENSDNMIKVLSEKHEMQLKSGSDKTTIFFIEQESVIKKMVKEMMEGFKLEMIEMVKEAIKNMVSTVKWFLSIVLIIVGGYGAVIGYNFFEVNKKADKKDVLNINTAKNLFELNGKYNDQRFVLKSGETIDKYNYQWYIETTFGDQSRGITRPTESNTIKR